MVAALSAALMFVGGAAVSVPEANAAAKQSRIPQFMIDAGAETGNSRESENFVVRWGDAVDVVEWGQQNGFDDYPAYVLDVMETTWDYYVDEVAWIDPDVLSPATDYRINLYLCGSWSGDFLPPANWAGLDEIGVGHMCLPYDKTWDDWVESHEFNHVLQSYAVQQNAANGHGGGFGNGNPNAGRFWEAHANFMARTRRPDVVTGSGYYGEHWYRWLAQETYYGDWMLLNQIRDTYGIDEVHRMWLEAEQGEHPIETMKRLFGLQHAEFAELIGDYALRNVVYDYAEGADIRGDLWGGSAYEPLYTVSLEPTDGGNGDYRIPDAVAPQQYGYNLIELAPDQAGQQVSVRLDGEVDPELGSDWRFGLVAVSEDFSVRYGALREPGETASMALRDGESHLMLAVAATPSVHVNYPDDTPADAFPYQLHIEGGTPEPGTTPASGR